MTPTRLPAAHPPVPTAEPDRPTAHLAPATDEEHRL